MMYLRTFNNVMLIEPLIITSDHVIYGVPVLVCLLVIGSEDLGSSTVILSMEA
jgi:hypothetical protein